MTPDRPARPRGRQQAVLAARLRRLDPDRLAAVVADLWAARGYETTQEGRVVTAVGGDERRRLVVAVGRDAATADADTVVAPEGVSGAEADRTVDADELARLVLYGLERPARRRLCETHLGASPDRLRPPPALALRRLVAGDLPTGVRRAARALTVVVAVLAVGAALAVAPTDGPPTGPPAPGTGTDGPRAGADGRATPTPTPSLPQAFPPGAPEQYPPGLNGSGLADAEALGAAHARGLAGASYTLSLSRARTTDGSAPAVDPDDLLRGYLFGLPPDPGVARSTTVAVDGDSYRLRGRLAGPNGTRVEAAVYHDGGTWQVLAPVGAGEVRTSGVARLVGPTPESLRRTLVDRYLSTPNTTLRAPVSRNGTRLYRLTATGAPAPIPDVYVDRYRATALVDTEGVVRRLAVRYTVSAGGTAVTRRVQVGYDDRPGSGVSGRGLTAPPAFFRPGAGGVPCPRSSLPFSSEVSSPAWRLWRRYS